MNRTALVLAALALALAGGLTACQTTTTTCSGNECTVNLSGAGADTEIFNDSVAVRLDSISGGSAEFTFDGQSATCTQGEALDINGYSVTCTDVTEDKLSLTVVG